MSETIIEHYGPYGRTLRFVNQPGLYPVNRYQSLVLANCAFIEAAGHSLQAGRRLDSLRALEVCCGGGPAAIVLKAAGVGYVEATDVNPRAIEICRRNADLNSIVLDSIATRDMLGPAPMPGQPRFDLIVCNPPCGDVLSARDTVNEDMRRAVDGGAGGIEPLLELIHDAPAHLAVNGILVFVLTSTMAIQRVFPILMGSNSHFSPSTPIAQPFVKAASPRGQRTLSRARRGEAFAWVSHDWVWRLTWVATIHPSASGQLATTEIPRRRVWPEVWFRPTAYDVRDPSYIEVLQRFTGLQDSSQTADHDE